MIHSLSKVGTFESCAAKYKFQYIARIPRGPPGAAASRGIDAHKSFEDFILDVVPDLPESMSHYTGWLSGLKSLEGIIPEAKLAFNVAWEDRPWEAEDLWWRGVLDLLVPPQDGTAQVYDWKTGKIYDDHEDQREIYGIATSIRYPDAFQVTCTHVYLDLGKHVAVTYHKDQLLGLREKWRRRFTALEKAVEFPYNPTYSCRWCTYRKETGGPCPF